MRDEIFFLYYEKEVETFHQYQQNEQSHLTSTHWTQKDRNIWRWKSRSWHGTVTKRWQG